MLKTNFVSNFSTGEMADERSSSSVDSSMNDWSSGQDTSSKAGVRVLVSVVLVSLAALMH